MYVQSMLETAKWMNSNDLFALVWKTRGVKKHRLESSLKRCQRNLMGMMIDGGQPMYTFGDAFRTKFSLANCFQPPDTQMAFSHAQVLGSVAFVVCLMVDFILPSSYLASNQVPPG